MPPTSRRGAVVEERLLARRRRAREVAPADDDEHHRQDDEDQQPRPARRSRRRAPRAPVRIAAMPNQTRTLPGARISSASRTSADDPPGPGAELAEEVERSSTCLRVAGTLRPPPAARAAATASSPNVLLAISAMPASEPISAGRLDRQHQHLLVRAPRRAPRAPRCISGRRNS